MRLLSAPTIISTCVIPIPLCLGVSSWLTGWNGAEQVMNLNGLFLFGLGQLILEGSDFRDAFRFECGLHGTDIVNSFVQKRGGFIAFRLGHL